MKPLLHINMQASSRKGSSMCSVNSAIGRTALCSSRTARERLSGLWKGRLGSSSPASEVSSMDGNKTCVFPSGEAGMRRGS